MQREMDDMLCTFAAPLLGPSAALSPTDPFMLDLFAEPTATALPLQPLSRRGGGAPSLAATAGGGGLAARLLGGGRLVPVVEVEERESEYVVTAEVPGFDKNEIKVGVAVLFLLAMHAPGSPGVRGQGSSGGWGGEQLRAVCVCSLERLCRTPCASLPHSCHRSACLRLPYSHAHTAPDEPLLPPYCSPLPPTAVRCPHRCPCPTTACSP